MCMKASSDLRSKLRSAALKKNKAHDPRLTHLPDLRCH